MGLNVLVIFHSVRYRWDSSLDLHGVFLPFQALRGIDYNFKNVHVDDKTNVITSVFYQQGDILGQSMINLNSLDHLLHSNW